MPYLHGDRFESVNTLHIAMGPFGEQVPDDEGPNNRSHYAHDA